MVIPLYQAMVLDNATPQSDLRDAQKRKVEKLAALRTKRDELLARKPGRVEAFKRFQNADSLREELSLAASQIATLSKSESKVKTLEDEVEKLLRMKLKN